MENTILLTNNDLMIDLLVAFLHVAVLINVGYAVFKAWRQKKEIGASEVIVLIMCVCISGLFLTQTLIQFARGGRSAIHRVWDILNLLVVVKILVTTNIITRYRGVNVNDDYPTIKKII